MGKHKLSKKEIAESFSTGKFKIISPYLSENVIWNIIGETEIKGKTDVITNCNKTADYFEAIETNFITEDVIVDVNKVVVRGTGEFIRDGKRVNLITACDVYEFNDKDQLARIFSYCIPEKR